MLPGSSVPGFLVSAFGIGKDASLLLLDVTPGLNGVVVRAHVRIDPVKTCQLKELKPKENLEWIQMSFHFHFFQSLSSIDDLFCKEKRMFE